MTSSRSRFRLTRLLPLLAIVVAHMPALASSTSTSTVAGNSYGTARNNGSTSSSVTAPGAHAESHVDITTASMGGAASIDGVQSFTATSTTTHTDGWLCPTGLNCVLLPPFAVPVSYQLTIDGTESGVQFYDFVATYSNTLGDSFRFEITDDSNSGRFAAATFNGANVPVTVTQDGDGTLHFSMASAAVVVESFIGASPGVPLFSDTQTISLNVGAGNGPEALDALHTFGIKLTSLDPDFPLVSLDGRDGSISPVPEPSTAALCGLGVAALLATWAARCRRS